MTYVICTKLSRATHDSFADMHQQVRNTFRVVRTRAYCYMQTSQTFAISSSRSVCLKEKKPSNNLITVCTEINMTRGKSKYIYHCSLLQLWPLVCLLLLLHSAASSLEVLGTPFPSHLAESATWKNKSNAWFMSALRLRKLLDYYYSPPCLTISTLLSFSS